MKPPKPPAPLTINGWTLFAHPLFLDQLETLIAQVEKLWAKDPKGCWRWLKTDHQTGVLPVQY